MLVFPDTILLLQCRDPKEVPWGEITAEGLVRLVVCRTVQSEIDRLKGDGRGRRSDRARKVSSWFARMIKDGQALQPRDHGPRVTLKLAPRVVQRNACPDSLDLARNDDRIVWEALAHSMRMPSC